MDGVRNAEGFSGLPAIGKRQKSPPAEGIATDWVDFTVSENCGCHGPEIGWCSYLWSAEWVWGKFGRLCHTSLTAPDFLTITTLLQCGKCADESIPPQFSRRADLPRQRTSCTFSSHPIPGRSPACQEPQRKSNCGSRILIHSSSGDRFFFLSPPPSNPAHEVTSRCRKPSLGIPAAVEIW